MDDERIDAEETYDMYKRWLPLYKGPHKIDRFLGWMFISELRIGIALFLLCGVIVIVLNVLFGVEAKDILVEANGLILDLALFACLIVWFNERRSFKDRVRSYQEMLIDLASWDSEEGVLKKVGVIRRLQDIAGVRALRGLDYSQLSSADLSGVNLEGSNFGFANLTHAFLNGTDFRNASLAGANLASACLASARLTGADLRGTNLRHADFELADLKGAKLGTFTVGQQSLEGPRTVVTDLRGAVGLTPEKLMETMGWEAAIRDEKLACGKPIPSFGSD